MTTVYTKITKNYDPAREDSAFYTYQGSSFVASVRVGEKNLVVLCEGEMRLLFYPDADENSEPTIIRYADDLLAVGIDTDKKLEEYTEQMTQKGLEVWLNNSWFEILNEDDEEFGICHGVSEAVDTAEELLLTNND